MDSILASAAADPISFALRLLIIVGVVGLMTTLVHNRCRALIAEWANRSGWTVVKARRCWFGTEQFTFIPGMPVYRVTLESRSGRTRMAYFRCGNATLSVLSDELAVEWAS
jgi:hypothetical protein